MKAPFIVLLLATFPGINSSAQNHYQNTILTPENLEVFNVIIELFDAYRAGDSTRLRAVFTSDAMLRRAGEQDGKPHLGGGSIDGFVKYAGSGLKELHNEQLWNYQVNVDQRLASVWTEYAFIWVENSIIVGLNHFYFLRVMGVGRFLCW